MRDIVDRLRFKFSSHPYRYNELTGKSRHFVNYSIFTDQVTVRTSQFGYVVGQSKVKRDHYLDLMAQIDAANASAQDAIIRSLREEVERLKPYEAELRGIAADLGEPDDPFAAWERIAKVPRTGGATPPTPSAAGAQSREMTEKGE